MHCSIAGASIGNLDHEGLLAEVLAYPTEILVLDADRVCGREHILSAFNHAKRAFENGTNASNTLGMEVMLYASGERQISKAKRKMGLSVDTRNVAIILLDGERELHNVLAALKLHRDDSVIESSLDKVLRFGITLPEIEAIGEARASDLVLERVAFVDIIKR